MKPILRQILISPSDDDTIFDSFSYNVFLSIFVLFQHWISRSEAFNVWLLSSALREKLDVSFNIPFFLFHDGWSLHTSLRSQLSLIT
jgi:DNA polymerase III sliding clamp (beta) subunit (PCNA family)